MDINKFSKCYNVRYITLDDIDNVYKLMLGNPMYFEFCPPKPSYESIKKDMNMLPPNKDFSDKYYVGFYDGDVLICVLDLIDKYPNDNTVFIGFFMVNSVFSNRNIGSNIIGDLMDYIKKIGYKEVRLGYVSGNVQSEHFWLKNGFKKTDLISKEELYDVVILNRIL